MLTLRASDVVCSCSRTLLEWRLALSSVLQALQCKEEISRLEVEQAKTMRVIIQRHIVDIGQLCETTGLPTPDLSAILAGSDSEGTVSEALHKLSLMLNELKAIVGKREPVIKQIKDVEEGFKEAIWLFQHQQDNLFNNRVCSFSLDCLPDCPVEMVFHVSSRDGIPLSSRDGITRVRALPHYT